MTAPLLDVQDLRVHYGRSDGAVRAVDGLTFFVREGEKFGLAGESGCGKSTSALAFLGLLRSPGRVVGGRILLDGVDLTRLSEQELRQLRFARISLVPQGAMNSLNPVMRVRDQIADTIAAHEPRVRRADAAVRVGALLESVGLRREVARLYPHELSGGMKQRVCIAMAIALRPRIIIADEPTSALDVVVQRQVLQTLDDVQRRLGAAVILVGHDMGVMAQFVDRIGIMYAGTLVEIGPVAEVFAEPLHPYTRLLIASLPSLGGKRELRGIPGLPPSLVSPPPGCRFQPRCPWAMDRCAARAPEAAEVRPGHWVSCFLHEAAR